MLWFALHRVETVGLKTRIVWVGWVWSYGLFKLVNSSIVWFHVWLISWIETRHAGRKLQLELQARTVSEASYSQVWGIIVFGHKAVFIVISTSLPSAVLRVFVSIVVLSLSFLSQFYTVLLNFSFRLFSCSMRHHGGISWQKPIQLWWG